MNTIDGREISKEIGSSTEYAEVVLGMEEEEYEKYTEENEGVDEALTKMIALIYSRTLLRNTSHICQSLPDSLGEIIWKLKEELKEKYSLEFKDELFNY